MAKERLLYTPDAKVCSKLIAVEVEDNKISHIEVQGGCHGNLQGIAALLLNMDVQEAIQKLEGIGCKNKGTSCPDQIAKALKQVITK